MRSTDHSPLDPVDVSSLDWGDETPRGRKAVMGRILNLDGRELTGRPRRDRRVRLENAVVGGELVLPVRRLARNGFEAWAEVIAHDYEGWSPKKRRACTKRGRRAAG
jgi:hypothetical protein